MFRLRCVGEAPTPQSAADQFDLVEFALAVRMSVAVEVDFDHRGAHGAAIDALVQIGASCVLFRRIHHRGQGYVYLRALGIAPPPFYERQ